MRSMFGAEDSTWLPTRTSSILPHSRGAPFCPRIPTSARCWRPPLITGELEVGAIVTIYESRLRIRRLPVGSE